MYRGVNVLVSLRLGNDLRTLLRLMSTSVECLKQRLAAGESTERELIELEGAIDRGFHISRELVALGRPSGTERATVEVNELVEQLEGVLARVLGPNIRVALQLGAVDAVVEADAVQLEWVFLNLAANSRDAMPDGGTFTIQTSSADRKVGTPLRTQRYIRVTVVDTGHGLFGDARTRAFDPFFSTKEGAAGLGLTSVAMIVRGSQGWLHIESDHTGTRIHIHLPTLASAQR
jgi:two-component system, cell cycle sensor histidine kinase and response regulator CckA